MIVQDYCIQKNVREGGRERGRMGEREDGREGGWERGRMGERENGREEGG